MFDRPHLGRILLSHGAVSDEQLEEALAHQVKQGCRLGESLVQMGLCTEVDIARALAEQMEIPFIDLEQTPPSPSVIRLLPKHVAVEYGVAPVRLEGDRLVLAARNPLDIRLDEAVRKASGHRVIVACAADCQLQAVLDRYDDLRWMGAPRINVSAAVNGGVGGMSRAPVIPISLAATAASVASAQHHAPPGLMASAEQSHTVQMVDSLIAHAVRRNASEISFEARADGLHVRGRIDGHMHPMAVIPIQRLESVLARVKIMSGIPLRVVDTPQTGVCNARVDGRSVRLECATLPSVDGEVIMLQAAKLDRPVRALDELGMEPETLGSLQRILNERCGLVLVSGPADSGRSTTLTALQRALSADDVKIMSVSDEPEILMPGVSQIRTLDRTPEAFAVAMCQALAHRPDVLMVSELPDRKTAEIAAQAAADGRLVICGASSATALGAVARLLDLGIAPHRVAASLSLILSQRLLRKSCPECAKEHTVSFELDRALRSQFGGLDDADFRKGRGCPACHQMGSRGRIGVFEMIEVDDDLRRLISNLTPPSEIKERLQQNGLRTLEEDAFLKAGRGVIMPEELIHLRMNLSSRMDETAGGRPRSAPKETLATLAEIDTSAWELKPEDEIESWDAVAGMVDMLT